MRRQAMIRTALELGRPTGAITFDQLDKLLPPATTEPDDIEAVMRALRDEGIGPVEGDESPR